MALTVDDASGALMERFLELEPELPPNPGYLIIVAGPDGLASARSNMTTLSLASVFEHLLLARAKQYVDSEQQEAGPA